MKLISFILVLFLSSFLSPAQSNKAGSKKVLVILIDGISTDVLLKTKTPFLDKISKAGAFSEAYVGGKRNTITETPTISAVGYNSMLTGTWVNKHNVKGNSILNPNYNYSTFFRLLKDSYPEKKIGIYSTWLDNRTKLLGHNLEETNNLKVDYHLDGLELDEEKFPHDLKKNYLKRIDAEVVRRAALDILDKGPDLSWVYLEHPDDMGHLYGDSSQLYEAVAYEDALVGILQDAIGIREEKTDEDWLIIITTDHGRDPYNGQHHGGQSDRERNTWIIVNQPITNNYFRTNKVGIVDIFPSVLDYMNISISKKTEYEIDGVSFIEPIDAYNLEGVSFNRKQIHLQWSSDLEEAVKAKVFVSYTNNFKTGGNDIYEQLGSVKTSDTEFKAEIKPNEDADYAKIVLETTNTTVSTWVKL